MSTQAISDEKQSVYVYELPLRLWHWVNAIAIVVLAITGYLIGSPLDAVAGEASDHYVMGYVRYIHFSAAYIMTAGFLFRLYWAYAGNEHARQLLLPPLHTLGFWQGVFHEILWYAFLVKEPRKYTGHNPLAILMMHFVLVWGMVFMIFTGFALYGEGQGHGSWQYALFTSWMLPLFGQSQNLHSWHHLFMWVIVCFIIAHVYVAIREDKLSRQTLLKTMVTGWRSFKDDRPVDDGH